jgi:hypothetical protein
MASLTTSNGDKKRKATTAVTSDSDGSFGTFSHGKSKREWELEIEKLKEELKESKAENLMLKQSMASGSTAEEQVESSDDEDSETETTVDSWSIRYRELRDFRQAEGHCKVPQQYAKNKSLGKWVDNQKQLRRKSKVPQDRVDKLDAIGFDWGKNYDPPESWDTTFEKIKSHVEMFDDFSFAPSSPLGKWCNMQRKERKRKKQGKPSLLSVDQLKLLNGIAFPWKQTRQG